MVKKIEISIVIPNWNGSSLLKKNLPKVLDARKNKKNNIVEIVIVDDGSTDNSLKVLEEKFKEVVVVKHKKNRGFSEAVNTGVRFSKGDYVCLLNTDVIPSKSFLESASDYLREKNVFGITLHEKGYGPAIGIFDGYIKHK